ncbi:GNAT family N-acetyltransferase [Alsobacter sp. R-9]
MLDVLAASGLPTDDLEEPGQHFFRLPGATAFGGYARGGSAVLVRSLAVGPGQRAAGIGSVLLAALLQRAHAEGAREAWLLTTSAAPIFARHGFRLADRDMAPAVVTGSLQFQGLCPASAQLMWRPIDGSGA